MTRLIVLAGLLAISGFGRQPATDFTGRWRLEEGSGTVRQIEVEQKGKSLLVKTSVKNSRGVQHLDVEYEIGGAATDYKGLDGDEFEARVKWEGPALVFEITEHEDGKTIPQKTVWTLTGEGSVLQVERETGKAGKSRQSVSQYLRERPLNQ